MNHRFATVLVCIAPLCLGGCVTPDNDRMTIGRIVHLETFSPAPPAEPTPADYVHAPSLQGIERGNWQKTEFLVPVHGIAHRQTYATHALIADKSERQRREYPTAVGALEMVNGSEDLQQWEAAANVGLAVADDILLLPRMLIRAPWRVRHSPTEAYQRYSRPERPQPKVEEFEAPQKPGALPDPQQVTP